ncbi:MAG: type II toxin-antitoxin system prevent-host-death family antitoxin [Acetobacteraceae bacterium]
MSAAVQTIVEEADTRLSELLDRAERGEEVSIRRHGRTVARLVPAPPSHDVEAARAAVRALLDLRVELERSGVKPFTLDEILSARHEGHKY